jgi:cation diffusion facilitator family transporter
VGLGHVHAHVPAGEGPERLRSVRAALLVNVALLAAKLAVFWYTGLIVMLAEALHSFTDALQTGFLLVAARLSALPPDEAHPFGHGRGENLAAIVIAMVFVFFVASELVREAVGALQVPPGQPNDPEVALVVLAASAAVLLWPLYLARRDMHTHGGVVRAQATESLNDLLGIVAAFGGIGLVMLGYAQADALAALAIAVVIVYNAIELFRANMPYLVGGSPPQEFYERVRATAGGVRGTLGVHSMAAEYVGPSQVHLDLHLTVPADMTIDEADKLAHKVRDRLEADLEVAHTTIHFCARQGELRRLGRDPEGRARERRAD